jgi:hypothetical protein
MAWALFSAPFNYDRRPTQAIAFSVQPGLRNLPRDVVHAAIKAGKATEAPRPNKATVLSLKDKLHGNGSHREI